MAELIIPWEVSVYPNAPGLLVVRLFEVLCWVDWCGILHRERGHPPIIVQGTLSPALSQGEREQEARVVVEEVKQRMVRGMYVPYAECRELWWEGGEI